MTSDAEKEVYKALGSAVQKYTYFLLAAAGAGIAFAANQTRNAEMGWEQLPLALGVLCWGVSFFFGCRHLEHTQSMLHSNMELLKLQSGKHPMAGTDPQLMEIGDEAIKGSHQ